jgi:hypothetical protein
LKEILVLAEARPSDVTHTHPSTPQVQHGSRLDSKNSDDFWSNSVIGSTAFLITNAWPFKVPLLNSIGAIEITARKPVH